jgi:hypothetical protein
MGWVAKTVQRREHKASLLLRKTLQFAPCFHLSLCGLPVYPKVGAVWFNRHDLGLGIQLAHVPDVGTATIRSGESALPASLPHTASVLGALQSSERC